MNPLSYFPRIFTPLFPRKPWPILMFNRALGSEPPTPPEQFIMQWSDEQNVEWSDGRKVKY